MHKWMFNIPLERKHTTQFPKTTILAIKNTKNKVNLEHKSDNKNKVNF